MWEATPELLALLHLDGPPAHTSETLWASVVLPLNRAIAATWPTSRPHDPVGKRLDLIVRVALNIEPDPVYFSLDLGKRQAAVGVVFDLQARQIRKYQKDGLEQLARVLEERPPPPLSHKEVGEYLDRGAKEQHLATLFRTAPRPRSAVHDNRHPESASARPSISSPKADDSFVPREALHERITEAVGRAESSPGPAIVYLHGEPGVGKTTYLRALYRSLGGGWWLDFRTDELFRRSSLEVLLKQGVVKGDEAAPVLLDTLLRFVEGGATPALMVLDGVSDGDLLERFAATRATSTILACGRSKLTSRNWESVRVGDMTLAEASDLFSRLSPAIDQKDAEKLAIVLGRRPRLIASAAPFASEDPTSTGIESLCEAIARDVSVAVDSFEEHVDERLTGIYQRLIVTLSRDNPEAVAVLALLAFGPHVGTPVEFVMAYLLRQEAILGEDFRFAEMKFKAAIAPLESVAVVRAELNGTLSISPVTQGVLRSLLWDALRSVMLRLEPMLAGKENDLDLSASKLYAEGWFSATAAGRKVVLSVLLRRFVDGEEGEVARPSRQAGGLAWQFGVEALWHRWFRYEVMRCIANGSIPIKDDGTYDTETFITATLKKPKRQSDEMLYVFSYAMTQPNPSSSGAPQGSPKAIAEDLALGTARMFSSHISTPYGELDTGKYFGGIRKDGRDQYVATATELVEKILAGPSDSEGPAVGVESSGEDS